MHFPITRVTICGKTIEAHPITDGRRGARLRNRVVRNLTRIHVARIHTVAHEARHRVVGEDELLGHVARASVEVAHVRTVVDRVVVDSQRIKSGGRHVEDGEGRRGGSAVARERTVLDGERLIGRSGYVENSAVARARGFKSQTIENDVLRPIESRREVGGDRR